MKKFILLISILTLISFTSCTENYRAKRLGGKMTVELAPNTKLINATWKDSDLWVLTREMKLLEQPEIYKFAEKSTYGLFEGEITFVETKTPLIAK
jgi:hypothetical protein